MIYRAAEQIGEQIGVLDTPYADVEMITHFYVVSTAGLVESWLIGEIDKTPEEIVTFLDQVIRDHTRGAKLRFEERGR